MWAIEEPDNIDLRKESVRAFFESNADKVVGNPCTNGHCPIVRYILTRHLWAVTASIYMEKSDIKVWVNHRQIRPDEDWLIKFVKEVDKEYPRTATIDGDGFPQQISGAQALRVLDRIA